MSIKSISRQQPRSIAAVTGPDQAPLYWDETVLLLSMDYYGSASVFQDNSKYKRNPIPTNAIITNAQSKFGGWSGYFDGSGDYVLLPASTDFVFGTSDFTIECWIYPTAATTNRMILGNRTTASDAEVMFFFNSSNIFFGGGTTTHLATSNGTTVTLNTWQHIAVSRVGSAMKLFLNGVVVASATVSPNYSATAQMYIGRQPDAAYEYAGYIDDFRITKGVGRYTQAFTPPQAAFAYKTVENDTYWSSTKLLIHADGANNANNTIILDSSSANHTVTRTGDVAQGTFSPFPVAAGVVYNTTDNIGSAYFDGSGDYLTLDGSADFAFGTGDFTIECWVYRTVVGASQVIYDGRPSAGAGAYVTFYIQSSNVLQLYVNGAAINGTATLAINTWYHVALSRVSGFTKMFVNGTQDGSTYTDSNTYINGASAPVIGGDGNSRGATLLTGYLANMNVIKGTGKYSGNFSIPAAPVTAHANTKLLLNFTNAAIRDETGKRNLTILADTKTLVAQNKFGGSSMYFDGTGDMITCPTASGDFNFGTGDFTVECWGYFTNLSINGGGGPALLSGTNSVGNYLISMSDVGMNLYMGTSLIGSSSAFSSILNAWHHLAVCRSGGVSRFFVDGIQYGGFTDGTSYTLSNSIVYILSQGNGVGVVTGYIDDFRVTKGVGRYTGNFAVPTLAFPNK